MTQQSKQQDYVVQTQVAGIVLAMVAWAEHDAWLHERACEAQHRTVLAGGVPCTPVLPTVLTGVASTCRLSALHRAEARPDNSRLLLLLAAAVNWGAPTGSSSSKRPQQEPILSRLPLLTLLSATQALGMCTTLRSCTTFLQQ